MVKNTNIQVVDNLTDIFRGYAALLRKIKQRVLLAQQRVIYAANEELLRMYWDVGEMLQQSQDADGWGKKTLQRLSVDLKNDYSEIKGFSVRNMQCMIQFFNEYNQELTMVKGAVFPITQPVVAQLGQYNFALPIGQNAICKKPSNLTTMASMDPWQTTSLKPCRKTSVAVCLRW